MSATTFILISCLYVGVLFLIGIITGRDKKASDFFLAGKKAPWYVVAFGMVGASLSGVTFISIPGWVNTQSFTYLQMVLGYMVGYLFIIAVLLPLYYRIGLTSIYTYLDQRFGNGAYKTGASFFILSRIIGASFRLFLVAIVVELAILEPFFSNSTGGVPGWAFAAIVAVVIDIIYTYTR